ncbi:MAG TPA: hypothetical protein VH988_35655 [Thermoanaerobaculia bacterium]|jgi:hypothetical protein|nr:hypothetical protein [Thermoanaerobaculia bacterium]
MTHPKDPLLQRLNSSGFPLQLRVQDEIEQVRSDHGWSVLASEHYWKHPSLEIDGYIDIITGYGIVRLVIECKKAAESIWLFLVPDESASATNRVKCLCTVLSDRSFAVFDWFDLSAAPPSLEAAFCLGQGEKDNLLLEKTGDTLLKSIEGFAFEELSLETPRGENRIYVPVVVTAADLKVCTFDPAKVNIETGRVESAEFKSVPWMRFRKGLAQSLETQRQRVSLDQAIRENERSVLVVQAKALADFLSKWNIHPPAGEQWPHWTQHRQR